MLALQDRLHGAVDGDFLVIAGRLAAEMVGGHEQMPGGVGG